MGDSRRVGGGREKEGETRVTERETLRVVGGFGSNELEWGKMGGRVMVGRRGIPPFRLCPPVSSSPSHSLPNSGGRGDG